MQCCVKFCISLALCSPLRTAVVVRWLATRERRQSDRSIGMIYEVKIVIGSAFALLWFEHGGRWIVSKSPTVCEKHWWMQDKAEIGSGCLSFYINYPRHLLGCNVVMGKMNGRG